jgi:hypothetical protein
MMASLPPQAKEASCCNHQPSLRSSGHPIKREVYRYFILIIKGSICALEVSRNVSKEQPTAAHFFEIFVCWAAIMTVINEDAVYKGKALHVAEFLSTFQGFFRRNDAERKGPISVEMIEEAIEYRRRLHEHYNLENKVVMLRKDGTLTDSELQEWQESVESSKASIEATSATIKAVHELLRRFEVWSTQALANQVLTHCVKDNKGNVSLCCSPVLNLPGAAHFFSFLAPPSANSQNHVCALGVSGKCLELARVLATLQYGQSSSESRGGHEVYSYSSILRLDWAAKWGLENVGIK